MDEPRVATSHSDPLGGSRSPLLLTIGKTEQLLCQDWLRFGRTGIGPLLGAPVRLLSPLASYIRTSSMARHNIAYATVPAEVEEHIEIPRCSSQV